MKIMYPESEDCSYICVKLEEPMKSYLKTAIAEVTNTVDVETGELVDREVKSHTYIANSRESFFLCYVTLLSVFTEISSPAIKTYAYLLESYSPGVLIGINRTVKEEIGKRINTKAKKTGTVDNALCELCKSGLLLRKKESKGGYYINPRYAFKGSTTDRNQSLKAIIELGFKA